MHGPCIKTAEVIYSYLQVTSDNSTYSVYCVRQLAQSLLLLFTL